MEFRQFWHSWQIFLDTPGKSTIVSTGKILLTPMNPAIITVQQQVKSQRFKNDRFSSS